MLYDAFVQIGEWNGEGVAINATYKENFIKTKRLIMIKALRDTMVFPNEGEHWGHFADNSLSNVVPMKETTWYQQDTFGLQTLDKAGKIVFDTTEGDHLQFTEEELVGWVKKYFV